MKRIWSLLVLALLIPCLIVVASAEESGTCGENLTWVYDSGEETLTVSGTGKMNYFSLPEKNTLVQFKKLRSEDCNRRRCRDGYGPCLWQF